MGFVYAGLWFFVAVVLFVRFRSESRAVLPMSLYFLFLGGWWTANEFLSADLMQHPYVWIVRGVSAVMLIFCMAVYYMERKNRRRNTEEMTAEEKTDS